MQNFVRRLVARNFRILDVFFCRRIGRTYKTLLTHLTMRGLVIRVIRIKRRKAHGFIRPKKARRK